MGSSESASTLRVALFVLFLGVMESQKKLVHPPRAPRLKEEVHILLRAAQDVVFCSIFVMELLLRVSAHGKKFLSMPLA